MEKRNSRPDTHSFHLTRNLKVKRSTFWVRRIVHFKNANLFYFKKEDDVKPRLFLELSKHTVEVHKNTPKSPPLLTIYDNGELVLRLCFNTNQEADMIIDKLKYYLPEMKITDPLAKKENPSMVQSTKESTKDKALSGANLAPIQIIDNSLIDTKASIKTLPEYNYKKNIDMIPRNETVQAQDVPLNFHESYIPTENGDSLENSTQNGYVPLTSQRRSIGLTSGQNTDFLRQLFGFISNKKMLIRSNLRNTIWQVTDRQDVIFTESFFQILSMLKNRLIFLSTNPIILITILQVSFGVLLYALKVFIALCISIFVWVFTKTNAKNQSKDFENSNINQNYFQIESSYTIKEHEDLFKQISRHLGRLHKDEIWPTDLDDLEPTDRKFILPGNVERTVSTYQCFKVMQILLIYVLKSIERKRVDKYLKDVKFQGTNSNKIEQVYNNDYSLSIILGQSQFLTEKNGMFLLEMVEGPQNDGKVGSVENLWDFKLDGEEFQGQSLYTNIGDVNMTKFKQDEDFVIEKLENKVEMVLKAIYDLARNYDTQAKAVNNYYYEQYERILIDSVERPILEAEDTGEKYSNNIKNTVNSNNLQKNSSKITINSTKSGSTSQLEAQERQHSFPKKKFSLEPEKSQLLGETFTIEERNTENEESVKTKGGIKEVARRLELEGNMTPENLGDLNQRIIDNHNLRAGNNKIEHALEKDENNLSGRLEDYIVNKNLNINDENVQENGYIPKDDDFDILNRPSLKETQVPYGWEKAIEGLSEEQIDKLGKKFQEAVKNIDLEENDQWQFINEEEGLKTWEIKDSNYIVRRGEIDAPFNMWDIVNVLRDSDQRLKWDKILREIKICHNYSEQSLVVGTIAKGTFPISDRSFCAFVACFQTVGGDFVVLSYDSDPIIFTKKGAVEGNIDMVAWWLTPLSDKSTKLISYMKSDPKIKGVPTSILRKVTRETGQLPLAVVKYMKKK